MVGGCSASISTSLLSAFLPAGAEKLKSMFLGLPCSQSLPGRLSQDLPGGRGVEATLLAPSRWKGPLFRGDLSDHSNFLMAVGPPVATKS